MPNHVTNILKCDDIIALPVFTERDEHGHRDFDFMKIIPMPEELNLTSGGLDKPAMSCYLTKNQDVKLAKAITNFYSGYLGGLFSSSVPHILSDDEIKEYEEKYKKTFDELAEEGKPYCENIMKYGCPDWYSWCCNNWGTKWNAYDTVEFDNDPDMIEFSTAWSPPEPAITKFSKMYPDKKIHLLYSDEFIGQFAGETIYKNGEVIEELYAEGLHSEHMGELLHKIFGYNVKQCMYIDKDGNLCTKECSDCSQYDYCDPLYYSD